MRWTTVSTVSMMDELTLEEVNSAIRRHLQTEDLKIAIVTGDAPGLRAVLEADAPTPISYATPKPDEVVEEDVEISSYPLDIAENGIRLWQIDAMFAESKSPDIR
jgi:zinc protease